jgi:hypothetical protein
VPNAQVNREINVNQESTKAGISFPGQKGSWFPDSENPISVNLRNLRIKSGRFLIP